MKQPFRRPRRRAGPKVLSGIDALAPVATDVADALSWGASVDATGTARAQLAYLLADRGKVAQLVKSFGPLGDGQRQGHVFEWMHELSFNLKAIAENDDSRALVTTWLGRPHAAADLEIHDARGGVVAEVQAKVVGRSAQRLSSVNGLSDPKYGGMDLLVPTDHLASTEDLLDRRLAMPDGPLHARYEDVGARLTDRVRAGRTASDPVDIAHLKDVDRDPIRFLSQLSDANVRNQLLVSGGTAGLVGAVGAGICDLALQSITRDHDVGLDWARIATRSAAGAAQSAVIAIGGQGLSLTAQHALATGASASIEVLADGTLPFAFANATYEIAAIVHGRATGRLTPQAAAGAASQVIASRGAVWACSSLGQLAIPVPVAGALIGATVGSVGAAMMTQGIRIAVAARDNSAEWDLAYEALLAESDAVLAQALFERERLMELVETRSVAFADTVLPQLEQLEWLAGTGHPDDVLDALAALTQSYGGTPLFISTTEFESFMADDVAALVLRLSP